jgi:hypothetical protein
MDETAGPLGGSMDWKYYFNRALEWARGRRRMEDAQFPTRDRPPTRACRATRLSAASSTAHRRRLGCRRLHRNVRSGTAYAREGAKVRTVRAATHFAKEALEAGLLEPLGRGCEALRTNGG